MADHVPNPSLSPPRSRMHFLSLAHYIRPAPFETEITFTIPSVKGFHSLKKSDISTEEVESAPGGDISHLQEFVESLTRKRCLPINVSLVAISLCFPSSFSHSS